jgi:hypothetical protein
MPRTEASISVVGPASAAAWDAALEASPHAAFFHSRSWAEICQAASSNRLRPEPLRIRFCDGTSAIVPLCFDTVTGFHVSSPGGTYGGWLSEATLRKEHAEGLARHLVREYPALTWRLNPFNELECASAPAAAREGHTRVLQLGEGLEALRQRFSTGHRAAVEQARRGGVEAAGASGDSAWAEYERLYQSSLERWGKRATPRHDARLFEELKRREGRNVRLWLARYQDEVVAGAILLREGENLSYWHGAARSERFHCPVHLLLHEAIEHACHEGLEVFDLGPSAGLEEVEAFKKGFGAVPLPSPVVAYERLSWHRRLRARLAELRP